MGSALFQLVPADALKIAVVLALALFLGLEREEHKQRDAVYAFGGVRTFPLIGLVSYALALLGAPQLVPWIVGFAVVGGFMVVSYQHKLSADPPAGLTTELSALATYTVAGLVQHDYLWLAATVAVLTVLLLELKTWLEGLTRYVASNEIVAVTKFLVLLVVILPIVPDRAFSRFELNPFKTWLVVVAVSGVSFASYLLQRVLRDRGGVMAAAILGGAYSSTVTTVVLARKSKEEHRPNLYAGAILTASAMMYVRLVLLLGLFNRALAAQVAAPFMALGGVGLLAGWLVSRRGEATGTSPRDATVARNPLELRAAILFSLLFVVIVVVTHLAREYLGRAGLYALAAIMGVTDVDPFILGLAQSGPAEVPIRLAATAIVIAAASNNVIKAVYAFILADRMTGRRSLALLLVFAALGLIPIGWL